jgi:hydrogenase maturation protein HypF
VASLAGVRDRVSYEGQAAVQLEWLALQAGADGTYPFAIDEMCDEGATEPVLQIDTRPLIAAVADAARQQTNAARIARRFHTTLVDMIAAVCDQLRCRSGIADVVLSGGVFLNALLTEEVCIRLNADAFRVYRHRLVPPNDGGLSLGQLAIAAALS